MAANINRVVLVGQPDAGSRAPAHAVRDGGLLAAARGEHAPQGRVGPVDRQAELLRHHRVGPAGRELRAVPREGPSRRDRRSARVARVGGAGRRQAPGGRGRRRERPVPRRPPSERRGAVRARRRDAGAAAETTSRPRRPTTTFRSRRPEKPWHRRNSHQQTRRRPGPATAPGKAQELPLLPGQGRRDRLQEPRAAPALHLGEGQDPLAPHHGRVPASTRSRSRPRSSVRARWPCSRTSARTRPMQIILLQDVEKLGLRGDVVDVARGYARNYLLPRRAGRDRRRPARVAELQRVDVGARDATRRGAPSRRSRSRTSCARRCSGSRSSPARPGRCSARSRRPTSRTRSGGRARCASTGGRSRSTRIKRIGRYTIPIEVFQDVHVEVKTLVVPEGGELPPEEELAALEAAEAEAAAAAAAEAETVHAEAEHADRRGAARRSRTIVETSAEPSPTRRAGDESEVSVRHRRPRSPSPRRRSPRHSSTGLSKNRQSSRCQRMFPAGQPRPTCRQRVRRRG